MKRKQTLTIVVAVVLIVVALAIFFLLRSRTQQQNPQANPGNAPDQGPISAQFAPGEGAAVSADSQSLSRVVHGNVESVDLANNLIFLSVQMDWPNQTPRNTIAFKTLPNSEYLCWPKMYRTPDGKQTSYDETVFLLDDSHKLITEGQTTLTKDDAAAALAVGTPVIFALQNQYASTGINNVFQIAIIGCQQ